MEAAEVSGMPAYDGTAVTDADAGDDLEGDAGLDAGLRLLGEPVEDGGVAVHEPHDEAAGVGLGGLDDELGARRLGQRLAVVAVAGVDDVDALGAPAGDDGLAGDLVDDDRVGGGEQLAGTHGEQAGVARAGADEGDARGDAGGGLAGRARGAHRARSVAMGSVGGRLGGGAGRGVRRGWGRPRGHEVGGAVLEEQAGEAPAEVVGVGDVTDDRAAQVGGPVGRGDDGAQRQLGAVHPLDDLGEGADGGRAPGLELGEEGALGGGAGAGVGVVEGGDDRGRGGVVGADLDGQGALARGRAASGSGRGAR